MTAAESQYRGHTLLLAFWSFGMVLTEILTYGFAIAARVLCSLFILIHAVAARRHWVSLRESAGPDWRRHLSMPRRFCIAAGQICCILIPIRFLLIPIMPVLIQAVIVLISVIVFSRLRLWFVTAGARNQAKEMTCHET